MEILKLNLQQTEPPPPSAGELRFQIALLASLGATTASLLARFVFDAPLVPELLAQAVFAVLPISLIAFVVGFFGLFAKHLAFLVCVLVYLALLTAAAFAFLRFYLHDRPPVARLARLAGFLAGVWLLVMLVVLPLLQGGFFGRFLRQGALFSVLSQLAIYAVYVLLVEILSRLFQRQPDVARHHRHRFSRRRVLRGVGFTVLAVGVYDIGQSLIKTWFQFTSGRVKGGDGVFPNLDGLALEVTPTADFYQVSKNPFDPELSIKNWQLEIGGLVETAATLRFADLEQFPVVEQYLTLACIDNPVGGNLIGNALWRGVRLKDLLENAQLQAGVVDIVFHAADGYTDSIPLERALNDATLLAFAMNGEPLTAAHGYPLRLLAPNIFGMKNVKWITRIEAVGYDFKGYWQKRGWDDRAAYQTMSRIDTPASTISGSTTIAGIAFAGERGIRNVEVSTDGGRTWEAAEIKAPLSQNSWVLWQKAWTPQEARDYRLSVRATDGNGEVQTSRQAPPDPSGATGHHIVTVTSDE